MSSHSRSIAREKQKVLLVESSPESQLLVEQTLDGCGIELFVASSLKEARQILSVTPRRAFALILLELSLPDGLGLSLFTDEDPWSFSGETQVILISGHAELESKLLAFDAGVDEYLVKPVNAPELRARVCSRLRKVRQMQEKATTISRSPLLLDVPLMKARCEDKNGWRELDLTGKEFKILYFLIHNEGRTLARSELIRDVWGAGVHVLERTVDTHVAALRRKLGRASSCVKSIPGEGYRFFKETKEQLSEVAV